MAGRVVAELGRPETPEETAARKAEFSKNYRNSQTFRNLIAALIATLAILVVMVLIVPRGDLSEAESVDAVTQAEKASEALARPVYAITELPSDWRTNDAKRSADGNTGLWTAVYSPDKESKTPGFVNLEQAFNSDEDRVAVAIPGSIADGTVTIDGQAWTTFTVRDSAQSTNVTTALGTQVGDDYVLLYGNADESFLRDFAANLTAQFTAVKKDEK